MPYDREQLDNIRRIKRTQAYRDASPRERKALFEATRVESNHRDLNYGDRDSLGILQQRNNGAWGAAKEDVATDAAQFLEAARRENTKGGSAGQLAQRVQRSAFPDRYDQHSAEADALIKDGGRSLSKATPKSRKPAATAPQPSGPELNTKGAVTAALLDKRKGMSLLSRINEQVSSGAHVTESKPAESKPVKGVAPKGRVALQGKQAAAGNGSIAELFWNGSGAANIKDGKRVGKGFVSGHTDHVHLAADRATMQRAAKLARKLGLSVGEYGKGITSGHATNSNHYKPFGAMDVSGPKMAEFARRVAAGEW